MENKSDVVIAKKVGGEGYRTNILDYTGFIIDDPDDNVRNRSAESPVKATEVYQKLKDNYWLLRDSRYYVEGGFNSSYDFQVRFLESGRGNIKTSEVDTIDDTNTTLGFPILSYIDENNLSNINKSSAFSTREGFIRSVEEMVDSLYDTVLGGEIQTLSEFEKIFYDSSSTRISFWNDNNSGLQGIINLLEPGSDVYTNKISLGPLIKSDLFRPGSKCIIDLLINYSRSGEIYTKTVMFTVFECTSSGIVKKSIDMIVGDDELKVYFDHNSEIIGLICLDSYIDEYIIDGCTAKIVL